MAERAARLSLTEPGRFVVGCNYWASHAGTAMWSDWRPDVVDADLAQLAAEGIRVLRVFPLWPVFQPLVQLYGGGGRPEEMRHGESPLADDDAGRAGVSREAMDRFANFLALAEAHSLGLIVGLVTGWMSGRLFVPPAFDGRNVLTDPSAIRWQVRFVRHFVRRFRDSAAILAWDLGNECNCMAPVPSSDAAWVWTSAIAGAIRLEDPGRPVLAGMHSLGPAEDAHWRIQDLAELTDVLTTHPYPIFTPHCDQDPLATIRSCLHATAESRMYADIGGRPCLCEEAGTLGPMIAGERLAAEHIRTVLYSLWAHDCHGLLWWCAYDQGHLTHAPYDWHSIERELGLFRADRAAKPVAKELSRFGAWLAKLPFEALPPRRIEAVCVLTRGQDQWAAAFATFVLAKQAGLDVAFQYVDRPLREAGLYLLPSVCGDAGFPRRFWCELERRVRDGATLYLSHHDCMLSPFTEPFGLEVLGRERRTGPAEIVADGLEGAPTFRVASPIRLRLTPVRAQVLGRETDGNPAFARARLGEGTVYFLSVPIEHHLSTTPGAFHRPDASPFWKIYAAIAAPHLAGRALSKDHPMVGVTEHPLDVRRRVAVAINYSPARVETALAMAPGWSVERVLAGAPPTGAGASARLTIDANDASVLVLRRE